MAKVKLSEGFVSVSGKLNKKDDMVYRTRDGVTHEYRMKKRKFVATEKQLEAQRVMREVNARVSEEMKNVDRKAYWQSIVDESEGRYYRARDAAYAYYYGEMLKEEWLYELLDCILLKISSFFLGGENVFLFKKNHIFVG